MSKFDPALEYSVRNAAELGDTARLTTLLSKVPSSMIPELLNSRDKQGRASIHLASRQGHLEFVECLVHHGCDTDIQDTESGWCPLQIAVYFGHLSILVSLLNHGADLYVVDNDGQCAIDAVTARTYIGSPMHIHPRMLYDQYKRIAAASAFRLRTSSISTLCPNSLNDNDAYTPDMLTDSSESESESASEAEGAASTQLGDRLCSMGNDSSIGIGRNRLGKNIPAVVGGEVHTWGSNATYTLGRPNTSKHNYQTPERLHCQTEELANRNQWSDAKITRSVTGKFSSACIDVKGNLYTWGYGSRYALGHGNDVTQLAPKQVRTEPRIKCVEVCLGDDHMVVMSSDRQVYTCGTNTHHQLGHAGVELNGVVSELRSIKLFRQLPFAGGVVAIAAGPMHTVCATIDNVYTFGRNMGQLGHPSTHTQRTAILNPTSVQKQLCSTDMATYADDFQITPRIVSFLSRKSAVVAVAAGASLCTACLTMDGLVYLLAGFATRCISLNRIPPALSTTTNNSHFSAGFENSRQRPTIVKMCVGVDNTIITLSGQNEVFIVYVYPALSPKTWLFTPLVPHGLGAKGMGRTIIDIAIGRGVVILVTQSGHVYTGPLPGVPVYNSKRALDLVEVTFTRVLGLHRVVSVSSSHRGDTFSAVCQTMFRPASNDLEKAFTIWCGLSNTDNDASTTDSDVLAIAHSETRTNTHTETDTDTTTNMTTDTQEGEPIAPVSDTRRQDDVHLNSGQARDESLITGLSPYIQFTPQYTNHALEEPDVAFYCVDINGNPHPTPITAHRRVLAKRSEFFSKMVHGGFAESVSGEYANDMVHLKPSAPVQRSVFLKALQRIYSSEGYSFPTMDGTDTHSHGKPMTTLTSTDSTDADDVSENAKTTNVACTADVGPIPSPSYDAEQLYYLMCVADEYQLTDLYNESEKSLCSHRFIDVRNVCDVYHGATLIHAHRLEEFCIAFMLLHLDVLLDRPFMFYEALIDDLEEGMLSTPWNVLVDHLRLALTSNDVDRPHAYVDDTPCRIPQRMRAFASTLSNEEGCNKTALLKAETRNIYVNHENVDVNVGTRQHVTEKVDSDCVDDKVRERLHSWTPDHEQCISAHRHSTAHTHKGKLKWKPLDVFDNEIVSTKSTGMLLGNERTAEHFDGRSPSCPWSASDAVGTEKANPKHSLVVGFSSLRDILQEEDQHHRRQTRQDGTTTYAHSDTSEHLEKGRKLSQRERKKALHDAAIKKPNETPFTPKPAWGPVAPIVPITSTSCLTSECMNESISQQSHLDTPQRKVSLLDVQNEQLHEKSTIAVAKYIVPQRRSEDCLASPKLNLIRKSGWEEKQKVGIGSTETPCAQTQYTSNSHPNSQPSLANIQKQQEDNRWKRKHKSTSLDYIIIEDRAIAELENMYKSMGIDVQVDRVVNTGSDVYSHSSSSKDSSTSAWLSGSV
eukprot:CFRG5270T1